MADEMFVDQNEVEGTASGVWNRLLAGNRRFAEANRNIRIVALKHARHLWTHTHRKRPY